MVTECNNSYKESGPFEKWFEKKEVNVVDHTGKSDILELFGKVIHGDDSVDLKEFVACKACKKVYTLMRRVMGPRPSGSMTTVVLVRDHARIKGIQFEEKSII